MPKAAPATVSATASATSRRLRTVYERLDCSCRQLALADEAASRAFGEAAPVPGDLATRDQDHHWRIIAASEPLGYLEAVRVGQSDVEQYDRGLQLRDGGECAHR